MNLLSNSEETVQPNNNNQQSQTNNNDSCEPETNNQEQQTLIVIRILHLRKIFRNRSPFKFETLLQTKTGAWSAQAVEAELNQLPGTVC